MLELISFSELANNPFNDGAVPCEDPTDNAYQHVYVQYIH